MLACLMFSIQVTRLVKRPPRYKKGKVRSIFRGFVFVNFILGVLTLTVSKLNWNVLLIVLISVRNPRESLDPWVSVRVLIIMAVVPHSAGCVADSVCVGVLSQSVCFAAWLCLLALCECVRRWWLSCLSASLRTQKVDVRCANSARMVLHTVPHIRGSTICTRDTVSYDWTLIQLCTHTKLFLSELPAVL